MACRAPRETTSCLMILGALLSIEIAMTVAASSVSIACSGPTMVIDVSDYAHEMGMLTNCDLAGLTVHGNNGRVLLKEVSVSGSLGNLFVLGNLRNATVLMHQVKVENATANVNPTLLSAQSVTWVDVNINISKSTFQMIPTAGLTTQLRAFFVSSSTLLRVQLFISNSYFRCYTRYGICGCQAVRLTANSYTDTTISIDGQSEVHSRGTSVASLAVAVEGTAVNSWFRVKNSTVGIALPPASLPAMSDVEGIKFSGSFKNSWINVKGVKMDVSMDGESDKTRTAKGILFHDTTSLANGTQIDIQQVTVYSRETTATTCVQFNADMTDSAMAVNDLGCDVDALGTITSGGFQVGPEGTRTMNNSNVSIENSEITVLANGTVWGIQAPLNIIHSNYSIANLTMTLKVRSPQANMIYSLGGWAVSNRSSIIIAQVEMQISGKAAYGWYMYGTALDWHGSINSNTTIVVNGLSLTMEGNYDGSFQCFFARYLTYIDSKITISNLKCFAAKGNTSAGALAWLDMRFLRSAVMFTEWNVEVVDCPNSARGIQFREFQMDECDVQLRNLNFTTFANASNHALVLNQGEVKQGYYNSTNLTISNIRCRVGLSTPSSPSCLHLSTPVFNGTIQVVEDLNVNASVYLSVGDVGEITDSFIHARRITGEGVEQYGTTKPQLLLRPISSARGMDRMNITIADVQLEGEWDFNILGDYVVRNSQFHFENMTFAGGGLIQKAVSCLWSNVTWQRINFLDYGSYAGTGEYIDSNVKMKNFYLPVAQSRPTCTALQLPLFRRSHLEIESSNITNTMGCNESSTKFSYGLAFGGSSDHSAFLWKDLHVRVHAQGTVESSSSAALWFGPGLVNVDVACTNCTLWAKAPTSINDNGSAYAASLESVSGSNISFLGPKTSFRVIATSARVFELNQTQHSVMRFEDIDLKMELAFNQTFDQYPPGVFIIRRKIDNLTLSMSRCSLNMLHGSVLTYPRGQVNVGVVNVSISDSTLNSTSGARNYSAILSDPLDSQQGSSTVGTRWSFDMTHNTFIGFSDQQPLYTINNRSTWLSQVEAQGNISTNITCCLWAPPGNGKGAKYMFQASLNPLSSLPLGLSKIASLQIADGWQDCATRTVSQASWSQTATRADTSPSPTSSDSASPTASNSLPRTDTDSLMMTKTRGHSQSSMRSTTLTPPIKASSQTATLVVEPQSATKTLAARTTLPSTQSPATSISTAAPPTSAPVNPCAPLSMSGSWPFSNPMLAPPVGLVLGDSSDHDLLLSKEQSPQPTVLLTGLSHKDFQLDGLELTIWTRPLLKPNLNPQSLLSALRISGPTVQPTGPGVFRYTPSSGKAKVVNATTVETVSQAGAHGIRLRLAYQDLEGELYPSDVQLQVVLNSTAIFQCPRDQGFPNYDVNFTIALRGRPSPIPAVIKDSVGSVVVVTSTLSGSMGSSNLALYQLRVNSLTQMAGCDYRHDDDLDVMVNPTRLHFGAAHGSHYRGTVIGNFIVLIGMTVLFLIFALIAFCFQSKTGRNGQVVGTKDRFLLALPVDPPYPDGPWIPGNHSCQPGAVHPQQGGVRCTYRDIRGPTLRGDGADDAPGVDQVLPAEAGEEGGGRGG